MMSSSLSILIPLPFLLYSCYTDFKSRKIKNYITYPLALFGLIYQFYTSGMKALTMTAGALMGVILVLYLIKGIKLGGGDVKLIIACSTFLNYRQAVGFVLLSLFLMIATTFIIYIKKRGVKSLIDTFHSEILSGFKEKQAYDPIVGAPVIFMAFLLVGVLS